mmetsp:Transcript_42619/g.127907  ORF Transcript_42619/g.127907 Transcript_42619/m.127907 type:complete len:221 (+) Transcript_42619:465-1127(+)
MPPQAICTARAESRGLSAGGWASMRARVPRCAQGAAGRAVARPPLRLRTPPGRRCGCGAQRGSRHAATCPRPLAEVRSLPPAASPPGLCDRAPASRASRRIGAPGYCGATSRATSATRRRRTRVQRRRRPSAAAAAPAACHEGSWMGRAATGTVRRRASEAASRQTGTRGSPSLPRLVAVQIAGCRCGRRALAGSGGAVGGGGFGCGGWGCAPSEVGSDF